MKLHQIACASLLALCSAIDLRNQRPFAKWSCPTARFMKKVKLITIRVSIFYLHMLTFARMDLLARTAWRRK